MNQYQYNRQQDYEGYREYERQKFVAGGYVDNLGTLALSAVFPVFDAVRTPEYEKPERTMDEVAQSSLANVAILRTSLEPVPYNDEMVLGRAAA